MNWCHDYIGRVEYGSIFFRVIILYVFIDRQKLVVDKEAGPVLPGSYFEGDSDVNLEDLGCRG